MKKKLKEFLKKYNINDIDRIFWFAVVFVLLAMICITSCAPVLYKSNQIKVTHVLALTETGDTVKIAMKDIRPTQVYNVVGYDFTRPYMNPYYDPWRNYWMYENRYRYYGNHINTNVYNTTPNWQPPVVMGTKSKTTGGGNNPVASNPVLISGGGKKVN